MEEQRVFMNEEFIVTNYRFIDRKEKREYNINNIVLSRKNDRSIMGGIFLIVIGLIFLSFLNIFTIIISILLFYFAWDNIKGHWWNNIYEDAGGKYNDIRYHIPEDLYFTLLNKVNIAQNMNEEAEQKRFEDIPSIDDI